MAGSDVWIEAYQTSLMRMNRKRISLAVAVLLLPAPVRAGSSAPAPPIRIDLRPQSYHVPLGQPVWVTFTVANESDEPLTLTVPGTRLRIPEPEISLPLSHIFSGGESAGVVVRTQSGREWDRPVGYRADSDAPILLLAPHGSVGRTVDLRTFYPALRSIGRHRVSWHPYGSGGPSDSTMITIAARKRVEIVTEAGTMTLELFYDDAPHTVENFLDLVQQGFYEGLTFHRIAPGYLIQGGCANGDGTGGRPDGKRIPGELSEPIHERGTVSMARLEDQPNSAGTQFFICAARLPEWDGKYTVFARLVGEKSFDTLEKLMATPIDEQGRPRQTLYLRTVRAYEAPSQPAASNYP